MLAADKIFLERETAVIFCNLANWDEKARTFSHHSPYYGVNYGEAANQSHGLCFAVDSAIEKLEDIPKKQPTLDDDEYGKMSLGKFNTVFIGGIAHELGHAFALPHCGERWDEKHLGVSLLGVGNHTYRNERRGDSPGAFLAMSSAMRLASRPLFSRSDKEATRIARLDQNEFQLSTNGTRRDLAGRIGAMRVDGIVKGTPPVYGVIAYFDSAMDGGYHAPTATAVPDADGRYAIKISGLTPCASGELRIQYCHANGAVSETQTVFGVNADGTTDLTQWELRNSLEPLVKAVIRKDKKFTRAELHNIESSKAPELTKRIARKFAATLEAAPKLSPSDAPLSITELPLGDARPDEAKVGWLEPVANRIPANSQIESPLLDSGKIYGTGLYAHAPSRYVFNLGGRWKTLRGNAGLHTAQQSAGSVSFVIKADGKEVFRSPVVRKSAKPSYEVDVAGVKTLELIVEDGWDGNGNDWGLWLDPMLSR